MPWYISINNTGYILYRPVFIQVLAYQTRTDERSRIKRQIRFTLEFPRPFHWVIISTNSLKCLGEIRWLSNITWFSRSAMQWLNCWSDDDKLSIDETLKLVITSNGNWCRTYLLFVFIEQIVYVRQFVVKQPFWAMMLTRF